jgi:hypothetical protein
LHSRLTKRKKRKEKKWDESSTVLFFSINWFVRLEQVDFSPSKHPKYRDYTIRKKIRLRILHENLHLHFLFFS